MMTDKEKLVELIPKCFQKCLRTKCTECEHYDKSPETGSNLFCKTYLIADHLIAHGVIFKNCNLIRTMEQSYKNGYENGQPRWISVKDRLPDNDTYILVTTDGVVSSAYWHNDRFYAFTASGVVTVGCVTHWMPLPEPPKGD